MLIVGALIFSSIVVTVVVVGIFSHLSMLNKQIAVTAERIDRIYGQLNAQPDLDAISEEPR